jgi:hypothetical protein
VHILKVIRSEGKLFVIFVKLKHCRKDIFLGYFNVNGRFGLK